MDNPDLILTVFKIFSILFTILAGMCAGLWAYLVFVVGRGMLPSAQFDIVINQIGKKPGQTILEVIYLIENKGQYPLIVSDLKTKIRYVEDTPLRYEKNPEKRNFSRLIFPNSLGKFIKTGNPRATDVSDSSIPVLPGKTFVQPGVLQNYHLTIALPEEAEFMLVTGMFSYNIKELTGLPGALVNLGYYLRMIPYRFQRINAPHTAEKVIQIDKKYSSAAKKPDGN